MGVVLKLGAYRGYSVAAGNEILRLSRSDRSQDDGDYEVVPTLRTRGGLVSAK